MHIREADVEPLEGDVVTRDANRRSHQTRSALYVRRRRILPKLRRRVGNVDVMPSIRPVARRTRLQTGARLPTSRCRPRPWPADRPQEAVQRAQACAWTD
jgi:hypothetical protein